MIRRLRAWLMRLTVQNCTRHPFHAGPCNGWPCKSARLLAQARAAYGALTPEQKAEHDRGQRISWVAGTLMLRGHERGAAISLATAVVDAERSS